MPDKLYPDDKNVDAQVAQPEVSADELLQKLSTFSKDDFKAMAQYMSQRASAQVQNPEAPEGSMTYKYLKAMASLFGGNSDVFNAPNSSYSRDALYHLYDEMDETTSFVTAALNILSDDATQPDIDGTIYKIEAPNQKVQSVLEDFFEDIGIKEKLSKWARAIAKYGDFFLKVQGEQGKGVSSIDDTNYPAYIERKDFRGKLAAFRVGQSNMSSLEDLRSYETPWSYVHFRHKGELSPVSNSQTRGIQSNQETYSLIASYGQSILRPAIKVYTQLRFVENMIILHRLTNSIRRNVFLINVGDVSPTEALETIKNYANLLKKDLRIDMDEMVYDAKKHTMKFDEDIFIPVSDPKNDVNIQQVGGDVNIAEQYDLEYLLNKLFSALTIPKAYLNYEQDLNARSTLIQLDIRYARTVSQLQNTLVSGLNRLARIHLAYRGMDAEMSEFTIKLTNVSAIDLEARVEQKSKKIDTARSLWDVVSSMSRDIRESDEADEGGSVPSNSPSLGGGGGAFPDTDTEPLDEPGEAEPTEGDDGEDFSDEATPEALATSEASLVQNMRKAPRKPMDLRFIAAKLLEEYLDFTADEVSDILGLEKKKRNESRRNKPRFIEGLNCPSEENKKRFDERVKYWQLEGNAPTELEEARIDG